MNLKAFRAIFGFNGQSRTNYLDEVSSRKRTKKWECFNKKKKFPTFYLDVNFCIHVDMNGISGITVVLKRMVEWIVAEDSNLNISLHWFIRS